MSIGVALLRSLSEVAARQASCSCAAFAVRPRPFFLCLPDELTDDIALWDQYPHRGARLEDEERALAPRKLHPARPKPPNSMLIST